MQKCINFTYLINKCIYVTELILLNKFVRRVAITGRTILIYLNSFILISVLCKGLPSLIKNFFKKIFLKDLFQEIFFKNNFFEKNFCDVYFFKKNVLQNIECLNKRFLVLSFLKIFIKPFFFVNFSTLFIYLAKYDFL